VRAMSAYTQYHICTFPEGYRPSFDMAPCAFWANPDVIGYVNASGELYMRPSVAISAGNYVISGTYVI